MVYLIMKESETVGVIPTDLIPLINERNKKNGFKFENGATWAELRNKYEESPKNGAGVKRTKDGAEYWYLPFEPSAVVAGVSGLTVLSREEILNFGFDVEQEENAA